MPLLERSSARLEATAAGVEVANAAQRVELAISECADAIGALRGLKGGRVSIGVVSTAKYFAPHALGAFSRAYPSVEIRLEVGNRSSIIAALEANTLDLALTGRPPEHLEVDRATIGEHPHVIVVRPDHPRARSRRLPASVLADETFLVREPGSGTRNLMERFFAESRVTPHIGMEMSSNETIKQAVMAGLGIAFLSAHTVSAELADQRLVLLDLAGLPVVRQWFIVKLARRRLLPAAQALRQFLIDEGEQYLPHLPHNRGRAKRSRQSGPKAKGSRNAD
jgi:LysR family transcriptional regulator for metE and metH